MTFEQPISSFPLSLFNNYFNGHKVGLVPGLGQNRIMVPNGQMFPTGRENIGGVRPNFGGYVNPMNGLVCIPRQMLGRNLNDNMGLGLGYYGPQYYQNYPFATGLGNGLEARQVAERNDEGEKESVNENEPQRSVDVDVLSESDS